jgi:MFS family permease
MTEQPASLANLSRLQARRRTWRSPILLALVALFWASLYTYPAILSPYLTELGSSLTMTGLVLGSYGLTQTILRLPAGILSDRLRNKRLFIIAGLVFALISATGLLLSRQVWLILIFRGLAGVAAAMWVHFSTLYLAYFPAEAAPQAIGRISFCNNIGTLTAMLAGSLVAQVFGWRYTFLLAILFAVPGLLLSFAVQEERPAATAAGQAPPHLRDMLLIGRDRVLFWSSILALLSQLAVFAAARGFVPQYASWLGASKVELGMLSALSLLPAALAALLGGSLLARWFKLRSLVIFGFLLVSVCTGLLPLIHSLPLLFVNQFISGIGNGFQMTILLALCTRTTPANRKASAMGFFQSVYGLGMIIGPTLTGFMADRFNLGAGFVMIGAISLLSAGLAALVLE